MSGIGEFVAARNAEQEPRLIVSVEWNPTELRFEALCIGPEGTTVVEPWNGLSVDWHYDGEKWAPDFENP